MWSGLLWVPKWPDDQARQKPANKFNCFQRKAGGIHAAAQWQAPAEPLPNPIQVFPLDLNMTFCKMPTRPPTAGLPASPAVIQVCSYPVAVYVPVPAGEDTVSVSGELDQSNQPHRLITQSAGIAQVYVGRMWVDLG